MPESGKSYPEYAQNLSNLMNGMFFFSGFTFTVVAILLTSLPNPKTLQSQLTLLFLAAVFYLTLFLAFYSLVEVTFYVEMPPLKEHGGMVNVLIFLTFLLIGLTFPLLFLVWDLAWLATISGLIWLIFGISIFFFVFKRKTIMDRRRQTSKGVSYKIQE